MNRPQMTTDPVIGEALFDVFNERGLALLLGVSHADACRVADERQAVGDRQWAGEIRIAMARRGPEVLKLRTTIERVAGRLEVWCEVDRLLPSGLTVAELFARVRPQLVATIEEAAARALDQSPAPQAVGMSIDVGAADPGIVLQVHDPEACAADLAGRLDYLQRIVEKVLGGQRACGEWRMGL
ncbi:hypothetical protein GTP56_08035 [Duganella sp. FT134W]|uniref:Uncharacterized protein n=1 Tax=Duganella margarita TaxID=2692170 RepID=A0A7X4KG84_9BURK|nr:hypothetical protein [Duganella margarita]MYM72145.1 hypothetical protein [Duganella margarita]